LYNLEKFDFRSFFKDSFFNIIVGAFISLSGFFYNWVYVNSLGLEDYGTLVVFNSYSAILIVILSISNQSLFSRLMTEEMVINDAKINIFTFSVLQILYILCIFLIWKVSVMFLPGLFSPQVKNYSNYIFLISAFNSFSAIPLGYFLGKNIFKKYRFYSGIGIIILFLLIVIFVLNKKISILTILRLQLISAFFVALFSLRFIYFNSTYKFDFNLLKKGLKYSLPIFVYTIFSILSDFFIKINLDKDFNSLVLGKYNVILLVSNLPIIFATAINSIFIQKILIYKNPENKIEIINFTAKFILILVFSLSFLLISFQELVLSIFNIDLVQDDRSLLFLFLLINSFIGFCWLQISNELAIHKITNGFYLASVVSFIITFFSYDFLTENFLIFGAGLTLILSNVIIFSFAFIYARYKVTILVKFKPLLKLFFVFSLFVFFYHIVFNFYNYYGYEVSVIFNFLIIFFALKYLLNLKSKLNL